MTQKQFLRVFQLSAPEVKYFYRENTWKNSQIIFVWWKWFKTWKNFGKEFASEGVEAAYVARTNHFIYNYLKIVTGSCNSSRHQRFTRKKFFENEISESISQKFHDQWKIA